MEHLESNPDSILRSRVLILLIGIAALAAAFTSLSGSLFITPFNMAVFSIINELRLELPWLTVPMILVTYLGSDPVLFVFVIILAVRLRRRKRSPDAAWFLLTAAVARLLGTAAKILVHSPRPDLIAPPLIRTYSAYGFPSGHALMSTVVFGSAAFLAIRRAKTGAVRKTATLVCVVLILAIGVSRIYLGVHWASDVVGGYLYGAFIVLFFHLVRQWFDRRRTLKSAGVP